FLKSAALAIALGLAGSAFAAEFGDAVMIRTNADTQQQYGRDSVFAQSHEPIYRAAQTEPQRYGRAGGYVGTERVEVLSSSPQWSAPLPAPANNTSAAPALENNVGRTAGGRFDHPDSAHGQDENMIQTR